VWCLYSMLGCLVLMPKGVIFCLCLRSPSYGGCLKRVRAFLGVVTLGPSNDD